MLGAPRLRLAACTRPAAPTPRARARGPPTTSTSRTAWRSRRCAAAARDAQVSVTLNLRRCEPATDSAADLAAAGRVDGLQNRIFLDPMLRRRYPDDLLADTADLTDWSFVQPGDLGQIAAPLDFARRQLLHADAWSAPDARRKAAARHRPCLRHRDGEPPHDRWAGRSTRPGSATCCSGCTATTGSRPWSPRTAWRTTTWPSTARVHDDDRIDYLHGHLGAVHDAVGRRRRRARLLRVVPARQLRVGVRLRQALRARARRLRRPRRGRVKDSARWYADVAARNALPDELPGVSGSR